MIVEDGEGVSRFVEVNVSGAATFQDARKAAEAVANSSLVKCAWYGGDPNWGRIIDALGYSTAAIREEMIDIYYNGLIAVKAGVASKTPPAKLREIVREPQFHRPHPSRTRDGGICGVHDRSDARIRAAQQGRVKRPREAPICGR